MIDIRLKTRTKRQNITRLANLLDRIDPSIHYGKWIRVLMAIYFETDGSEEGFELADEWSSGGNNYMGTKDVRAKWRGLRLDLDKPVTIGTLIYMAKRSSVD